MCVQMTSLDGERACWVPPPSTATNNKWDFLRAVTWLVREGALGYGDALVLDNARIHFAEEAKDIVDIVLDTVGARILFLPAYSPELNPCEFVFGYVKGKMCTHRGAEDMWMEALQHFANVTNEQMDTWYRHCILGPLS